MVPRHRSPLSVFLPTLAFLLGALGLFATNSIQAQPVWSATLTVKALDEDEFTHDDTEYRIHGLILSEGSGGTITYLNLLLSKSIPTALKAMKLCVGTTGFAISDGNIHSDEPANDNNAVRWDSNSISVLPSWSVNEKVSLSLGTSCPTTQTFGFENATYLVNENVDSFVLAVQASAEVAADTTITIASSDGTSTPSDQAAERGTDYGGTTTRTMTMTTGTDRVEFTQVILDDNVVEPTEKFTLTITEVTSGSIGTPASTVVTIADQDVTVQFASSAYEVAENSLSARTVILTVTPVSTSDFTVGLGYAGSTMRAPMVPTG